MRSVVIAGPAGVGRTRLAREAVAVATRQGRPASWAAGAEATSAVPLGALAHLIPAVDVASGPLALLQHATAAIVGEGSKPAVLAVDDVHLLDQLSITLLHQLAAGGAVPMILTVRTGGGAKDPVAALWKDGRATRFDLQPLGRADTEDLLSKVLGGELESRTAERLWQLTLGNPLFLREVVEDGRTSGRLQRERRLWRWEGEMSPSQRLVDIVLSHIGDLGETERRALELLATAEPVGVEQFVALIDAEAVASLERRGVISDHNADRPGTLRVAHPMYSAVVRSQVSGAPTRLVRDQRAAAVGSDPGAGPEDLLRRFAAMAEPDLRALDPAVLTDGAYQALAVPDVALAERLGRAAVEAGGGVAAYLPLVEATRWVDEPTQSESLAVEAAPLAVRDTDTARLAAARALNLFCALGRPEHAAAAVRDADAAVRTPEGRSILAATASMLAVLGGEPDAQRAAEEAFAATRPGDAARPLAAAAAAWSLAMAGQTGRSLVAADAGWAALQSTSAVTERLLSRVVLAQAEVLAMYLAGRIGELDRRTQEWLQANLTAPEWAGDAIAAMHRGWAALAAGHLGRAARWLEEALSGLERRDPAGMKGFCSSLLVTAYAVDGDVRRVREVLAGQRSAPRGVLPVFRPVAGLAHAWVADVEGRVADAGTLALEAAAHAAEQGQPGVQALLLHRAVHFGRAGEVADRLRDLAASLDSALVADLAAHAQAAAALDGGRLEEATRRLERTGTMMFAADSAAAAAAAYQRTGALRHAAEWTTKARSLAQACGLVGHPEETGLPPADITTREAEVAQLAGQGLSNRAIADRLYLSVRTVETHLSHVYTKLGIGGRADLAAFLPMTSKGGPRSGNRERQPSDADHR